jgi:hypothetical protein
MTIRRLWRGIITIVLSLVSLSSIGGAALPSDEGLDLLSVHGEVLPAGDFVGTLRMMASSVDATGQLRLSGVLNGTVSQRTGDPIPVREQSFTAPMTLCDPGRTTDVILLVLAPIALHPVGVEVQLAPVMVDVDTLPDGGEELAVQPSTL